MRRSASCEVDDFKKTSLPNILTFSGNKAHGNQGKIEILLLLAIFFKVCFTKWKRNITVMGQLTPFV